MAKPHLMLVHFPIALLIVAVCFEAIGRLRKNEDLQKAGLYTLGLGFVGAVLAVVSGKGSEKAMEFALDSQPDLRQLLESHESAAFLTVATFAVLLLWRTLGRRTLRGPVVVGYLLGAAAGLGSLVYAGYLGGEIAHAPKQATSAEKAEVCGENIPVQSQGEAGARLRIENLWARPSAMTHNPAGQMGMQGPTNTIKGPTSAIYAVLVNTDDQPDALVAVRTDVAEAAELHKTSIENDVMRMEPVPRIEIPANGKAEMKRGGLHIMLLGVKQKLAPGDRFEAVLLFERAGEVPVKIEVREQ